MRACKLESAAYQPSPLQRQKVGWKKVPAMKSRGIPFRAGPSPFWQTMETMECTCATLKFMLPILKKISPFTAAKNCTWTGLNKPNLEVGKNHLLQKKQSLKASTRAPCFSIMWGMGMKPPSVPKRFLGFKI